MSETQEQQKLANEIVALFNDRFSSALSKTDQARIADRMADLSTQYLVYIAAAKSGAHGAAIQELKHIEATMRLLLAQETALIQASAVSFVEGALKLGVSRLIGLGGK
jgi:hypothetical protein